MCLLSPIPCSIQKIYDKIGFPWFKKAQTVSVITPLLPPTLSFPISTCDLCCPKREDIIQDGNISDCMGVPFLSPEVVCVWGSE